MIPAIRAEFRKLFTVRSTYVILALATLLVLFFAGYIEGWRLAPADLNNPEMLASDVFSAVQAVTFFGAIVAILLMTHEYRYNTIMYTLTSSNSRTKVLLAKILAVSAFALFFAAFIGILSPVASYVGAHLHGHDLVPQTLHYGDLIWRALFYGWAYGMTGLLFALLVRSQVGAIAGLFIVPGVVEQLLTLLLKHNGKYLPFSALDRVLSPEAGFSATHAAAVFGSYLLVGWIVAWILFVRRDAN